MTRYTSPPDCRPLCVTALATVLVKAGTTSLILAITFESLISLTLSQVFRVTNVEF